MLTRGHVLHTRYEIEQFLGGGGFGRVYRALDRALQTTVAIKELYVRDAASLRRFEREARLLARLRHPALPAVIDHFIEDNIPYVVMDYIPGRNLEQYLEIQPQQRLSEDEALEIINPILHALYYLHNHEPQILHRDIKPSNIRITSDGKVFLVDFGLAKTKDPYQTATATPPITPGYSPLEQYYGDTVPRSDLYALGATLYRMLTGVTPPDALRRKSQDTLVSLRKSNSSVSFQTAAVVDRLLALSPEQRYQNVTSVSVDLPVKKPLSFLQGLPPSARSSTLSQETNRLPRFNPIVGALAAIIVLVIGIVAALFFAVNPPSPVINSTAELAVSTLNPLPPATLTPLPPATATVQAIDAAATALCTTSASIAFSAPQKYTLAHKTGGSFQSTGVSLTDFTVEAYFENPYDHTVGGWDYGFTFPRALNETTSVYFAVVVDSDQKWNLIEYKNGEPRILASDRVDNLTIAEGGTNYLRLYVRGEQGSLFVNSRHITELKLVRDQTSKGVWDIWITTGIMPGHAIATKKTGFERARVCASQSAVAASFATGTAVILQNRTAAAATSTVATAAAQRETTIAAQSTATVLQATALVANQRLQVARAWPVKFTDTFSPTLGVWDTLPYSDTTYGTINRQVLKGIYIWSANAKQGVIWFQTPITDPGSKFYITTTIRLSGPTTSEFGLIFRNQLTGDDNRWYYYNIRGDQTYGFVIREPDKTNPPLIKRTFAPSIKPNAFNQLTVVVEGDKFYFYINGQYINEYQDSALSSGTIGIAVKLSASTKSVLEIDGIEVRAP